MPLHIAGRLDIIDNGINESDTLQMLSNFSMFYADKALVSFEEGKVTGKKHLHMYMLLRDQAKPIQLNAVRAKWKRIFKLWDGRRQQKALAICKKPQEYLSYLTKDGDIRLNHNVDLSTVPEWQEPTDYGNTVLGKLRKYAAENHEEMETLEDCARVTFRYNLTKKKIMNKYRMFDIAQTLYFRENPEEAEEDFVQWVKQKDNQ